MLIQNFKWPLFWKAIIMYLMNVLMLPYFHIFLSGEFTLRAFLNGRLDLSQAENVGRLIAAKSVASADAALEGIQARAWS